MLKTPSSSTLRSKEQSSEEALDNEESTLNAILHKFRTLNESQDLGNTEEFLLNVFNSDSNVCLICLECVENRQAVWNCEGCFCQFHIVCIQNWIKDGSYLMSLNISADTEAKSKEIPWNCPKCRKEYSQSKYPTEYVCYCRKVRNPVFDPWSIPHSCNQICERKKPCGHSCLTICHPGPCPPCPKMVKSSCHCSKSTAVPRRCSNKHWSCNQPCSKLLTCKQHRCERVCHANECETCNKVSIQPCRCGKQRKEVPCIQTDWQCAQICAKTYSCGFHKCELVCHDGACGQCPRSLQRTCPCGKSASKAKCTEDIATCGDTCDKKLTCNIHTCASRCHYGACDSCRQVVLKRCRCGQKEKEMACRIEFTCELKCTKMRNCGKHKCNRKCCDGNCPPCEQICNKTLNCKNHKCANLCHSGPCYPCPIKKEILCPCQSTKLKLPCSKASVNVKVPCKQTCKRASKCHHEKIQTHRCHYDSCPPCKLTCGLKMNCGHACQATCHSAVLTEIVENKDREGPWVKLNIKHEYVKQPCRDCQVLLKVTCLGKHETSDLPCYRAKPYPCGRECGRLLNCTHHTCKLECHELPANVTEKSNTQTDLCESCERSCEQTRPPGCEHECSIGNCHEGPCPDCTKLLKLRCHCKTNLVYVECCKWNRADAQRKVQMQSCQVPCTKTISCGHQCTLNCHAGECTQAAQCTEKQVLKCACKTLRKSVICNQLEQEKGLKVKMEKGEKRFVLDCSEKCGEKKRKEEANAQRERTHEPEKTESCNNKPNLFSNNQRNVFIVLSVLVLMISFCVFYFYPFLVEND